MSWQEVSLAGISESVSYGYTASASEDQVGPKFLRITDIVPECLDWDSVPYCKASERDQNRFSVEVGDIVVARTGATVGYAKQIRMSRMLFSHLTWSVSGSIVDWPIPTSLDISSNR